MNSILHTTRRILSDKKFSVLAISIAVLARIIQLTFFYNIRVDGMYQVLAMQNFVQGRGFSSSYVLAGDLSTILYEPQMNWPPGYSLLLAPFYLLFNHNYIYAGIAMDVTAAIVLVFFTRRILKLLEVPPHRVNIFTILTGFFMYSFYLICSSDAIAITFFIAAIYYSLLLLKKERNFFPAAAGVSICLIFAGLIKYLFIPAVFIIPVFIFLNAASDSNRRRKQASVFIFLFLFVSLGGLLLWQKMQSGSAGYISSSVRGFYPGNLAESYPALPASFINPDSISLLVKDNTGIYNIIFRVMQGVHFALVIFLLFYVSAGVIKKGFGNSVLTHSFTRLSVLISATIIILLTLLSLRVGKEENIPGHWWTYVEEPRYYGLITVFIHLGIFMIASFKKVIYFRGRYVFYFLLILLLPEAMRGVLFTANRLLKSGKEEYSWQHEKEVQDYAAALIKNEIKKHPDETAIVTGSWYYMYYRVGMYSHVPVLTDTAALRNIPLLNTKRPAMLFVITSDADPVQESADRNEPPIPLFPELYNQELAGTFAGYYFHVIHVKPH